MRALKPDHSLLLLWRHWEVFCNAEVHTRLQPFGQPYLAIRGRTMADLADSVSPSRIGNIVYWVATSILATECIVGGVMGAVRLQPFFGIIEHLGYPAYFMTLIGVWYVLAGVALLVPTFPRLKEWAYAGLVFNYTGAAVSHLEVGDRVVMLVGPAVFTCLVVLSYAFRPASRRLGSS